MAHVRTVQAAPLGTVTLNVNGFEHSLSAESRVRRVLRNWLGLTGTTKGCDQGACSAFTVSRERPADRFLLSPRSDA